MSAALALGGQRCYRNVWMRTLLLSLSVLCAVAAVRPAHAEPRQTLDRIAAVVNDEVILMSQVRKAATRSPLLPEALGQLPANATPEQRQQKEAEVRIRVLDELIDKSLMFSEAERFQITATDADVDRALPNVAASYGMTVDQLKTQVEGGEEYGSWTDYRKQLREDILLYKITQFLATWNVTEAQVREYYRKMTRDESAKVDVERFVFAPSSRDPKARDEAFAGAQIVARRLRAGEPSAKIAASLRYDRELEQSIGRGEVAPALEDAVFAARAKEVVGPLPSGQGYVVFKILKHQESSALSYEEAKDRIRAQLENEAFLKAEQEFKQQLRAKAHLDIRL